jgi:predicted MFS family arabinose efflux permease
MEKFGFRSWIIFGIASLFYLYELVLRVAPSVMLNDLAVVFNATSTVLGILISSYYYSYTILQVPCGVILDKIGPKNLIGTSTLLCVFGTLLFTCSDKICIAQVGRFLVGAGSACAFISCLQIASNLFPKKYFVILTGITNMMGTFGGLLGGMPIAKSINSIGLKNTTYLLMAVGGIIAILVFLFIPKNIGTQRTKTHNATMLHSIIKLLKNRQVILSSLVAGFLYLPVDAFAELWAVPFFMTKYAINNERASIAPALLFIGIAVGSIVIAIFAKKIGSYVKTIKISSLLTIALFIPLIFTKCGMYAAFFTVFGIGFLTGAQPIGFTCAKNNVPQEISGTTIALVNCIIMSIGAVFQPFLGILLDYFWNGTIGEKGVRIYDVNCYQCAILIIPVFLIIAYFLSIFMKETAHLENE